MYVQIGLTGFKCRCGYVFCGSHRLAEAHECDFDYKTTGRDNLAKANPLIQVRSRPCIHENLCRISLVFMPGGTSRVQLHPFMAARSPTGILLRA